MPSSGMLHRVTLVRTDDPEEHIASIITVTTIGEVKRMLSVTSNTELRYVPPKRQVLQEPHGVAFQKTAFFIVTAVKTSNLA
jgi:hypothetical protein